MRRSLIALTFMSLSAGNAQIAEWKCKLAIQDEFISFRLLRNASGEFQILNGTETVQMELRKSKGDSLEFALSVFDASLIFPTNPGKEFNGWYRKGDAKVPGKGLRFSAQSESKEEAKKQNGLSELSGKWPIEFLDNDKVQDKGILLLNQEGVKLSGTIMTETGDYRFLNGEVNGNNGYLQTFDGGHAYYFRLKFSESGKDLNGEFLYSGSGKQVFRGKSDETAQLSEGFTDVAAGKKISFSAKDESGRTFTQSDREFSNRPLVIQVLGTWCPNCLDETRFLVEEYGLKNQSVEFLGLAFERKDEAAYAFDRIATVKRKLNVPYPILWAGKANKDSASKAIPAIGGVKAFPTTIFVNRKGEILKVHSGFSGPATGEPYEHWRTEFRAMLREISKD